jgi:hypothetical protein
MKEEPVLKIRKGFHPLHMMCVPDGQYIHNDTMIKGGSETGDISSMVSGWEDVVSLTSDGRHWRQWFWQVGVRQAGCLDHLHGPHRLLRPRGGRRDWHLRQSRLCRWIGS